MTFTGKHDCAVTSSTPLLMIRLLLVPESTTSQPSYSRSLQATRSQKERNTRGKASRSSTRTRAGCPTKAITATSACGTSRSRWSYPKRWSITGRPTSRHLRSQTIRRPGRPGLLRDRCAPFGALRLNRGDPITTLVCVRRTCCAATGLGIWWC